MQQAFSAGEASRNGHLADLVGQVPIFAVASLLFAACTAVLLNQGIPLSPELVLASGLFYLQSAIVLVLLDAAWVMIRHRPDRLTATLFDRYTSKALREKLLARLPLFLVLVCFMPVFSQMKSMIPLFNDYDWDATFIAWDRALLGKDAWLVLQPIFGFPIVTSALSMLYHGWTLLLFPGTLVMLMCKEADGIRNRYFLGFVLIWSVIGTALAIAFASVGPCFVEPILGDNTFAAQMAYLNAANAQYPVLVLHVQDLLLDWYRTHDYGFGRGITAMPSMHVSMAFLYWLAIRHVSRVASWIFFAFFVLIWIASVHLAYHYAVDGLVSVIVTGIIWSATRHVLNWWDRIRPSPASRQAGPALGTAN